MIDGVGERGHCQCASVTEVKVHALVFRLCRAGRLKIRLCVGIKCRSQMLNIIHHAMLPSHIVITSPLVYTPPAPRLYASKPSWAASLTVFLPSTISFTIARIFVQSEKTVKGTFSLAQ
jgi:hypothetical protein